MSIGQKTAARELLYGYQWKATQKRKETEIILINLILAEDIAGKFYPAETDEDARIGLLSDLADFINILEKDIKTLGQSDGLIILRTRTDALQAFLENNQKK